MGAFLFSRLLK